MLVANASDDQGDQTNDKGDRIGEWREDVLGWHYEGELSRVSPDVDVARTRVRAIRDAISRQHPDSSVFLTFYDTGYTQVAWDDISRSYTVQQVNATNEKFRITIYKER